MVDERIDVPNNFLLSEYIVCIIVSFFFSEVLDPLQAKSMEYLNKFGKMYVISGTATDINHDGIADSNGLVIPS